ncbi:MAG: hypothetical protein NTW66_00890 [Candidatus Magasanikbacteria bacterium]|nr:hypothetical protein [Candidatus Magasanikbacteria bacterium]
MSKSEDSYERGADGSIRRKKAGLNVVVKTRSNQSDKQWWGIFVTLVLGTAAAIIYIVFFR